MTIIRRVLIATPLLALSLLVSGCVNKGDIFPPVEGETPVCTTPEECASLELGASDEIPRFGSNSPFDVDYEPPKTREGKRLWARSVLFAKAPELHVEKWLTDKPDTEGKYVLIEFWATWCPPCRRTIPKLNRFHERFKDELAIIAISDETEAAVRKLKEPKIEYPVCIDTKARTKKSLQIGESQAMGIPHVLIVEPGGYVVWEGFPLLEGYELTEELMDKILQVGRDSKKQ